MVEHFSFSSSSLAPPHSHQSAPLSTSSHSAHSPLTVAVLQVQKQAMLWEKAMEIPEIVVQVVSYLRRKDLTQCVRVSKSWQDMFLPHIWRVIYLFQGDRCSPSPEDLYPHRHLIHSLSFSGALFELDTFIYPNLRSLKFIDIRDCGDPVVTLSVDLTEMCPLLAHLELVKSNISSTTWTALSALPHLKSLELSGIQVQAIDTPWFWKVCEKLEKLRMFEVSLQGPIPEDSVFNRLRQLNMSCNYRMDEEVQIDLIYRSAMLESLTWNLDDYRRPETRTFIRYPIQSNHWPNLHELHIYLIIWDTELASFLRGAGNGQGSIVRFEPRRCELGTQASRNLSIHFNTLVMVDISDCNTSTRSTVPDILCGCPNLKELRAVNVFAKDIAERGPWVCHQLRALIICFRVEEPDQHPQLQQLVFQRLSTLIQLKLLRMCVNYDDEVEGVLEFRLDCGLGQLASLQELSTVSFSRGSFRNYEPQLGMEEVVWMAGNWRKLKTIGGCLNRDVQLESQLIATIGSLGIRYASELYV